MTSATFGTKLRDAREQRGISLRQIANATKISIAALEALERDDISRLPGGIFTRAFVRSYALEVGLDPEQTIRDFMLHFPHDSVTAGHPASTGTLSETAQDDGRRIISGFVKLLAMVLPVAAFGFYVMTPGRPPEQPATASSLPRPAAAAAALPDTAPATDAPATLAFPARAPAASEQPASTAGRMSEASDEILTIGMTAADPCWVSITVDGTRAMQRELQPGEDHTFEVRKTFALTAGNAGALAMTLNGAPAKPLGKSGEVVTKRLDRDNFKAFLREP